MTVLRKLCEGEPPSSIPDTIAFLAISWAICLSCTCGKISEHRVQFVSDLGQWQSLFKVEDGSLQAFQNAVKDIWGFNPEDSGPLPSPDSTSGEYFRGLAMSLITSTESSLNLGTHDGQGLLSSQARWILNSVQNSVERQGYEPCCLLIPEDHIERGELPESDILGSDEAETMQHPEVPSSLIDAMYSDLSGLSWGVSMVLGLMAGFIFSVLVSFLIGKLLATFIYLALGTADTEL